jgi:anti-sigma regulatory factor (Ser/Thr protein kinase)
VRREVILPPDESAAPLARSSLSAAIPPPDLLERGDDAQLAVTELAANAIRHGDLHAGDIVRLVIEADDDGVHVEVQQPTSARDVHVVAPRLDDPVHVGGFGLRLVEHTADSWGHDDGPPGRVWFEFRRPGT